MQEQNGAKQIKQAAKTNMQGHDGGLKINTHGSVRGYVEPSASSLTRRKRRSSIAR